MYLVVTDSTADKPAQVSGLKLPRRACISYFGGAFPYNPTGFIFFAVSPNVFGKEKHLSLNVRGYFAPALFIAVDSFKGGPE
jgi:hypothetical protein